ncbi:hypothetical protein NDA01_26420 [Trichocoleus desertorum AS-A10]|uniref:hypothetical protein n=1 Tax=Trichocoleus desertorum TaxID=1481672 RepID=UPI00329A6BD5
MGRVAIAQQLIVSVAFPNWGKVGGAIAPLIKPRQKSDRLTSKVPRYSNEDSSNCWLRDWSDRASHQIRSNPVLGIFGRRVKEISLKPC